jgi:hypothetical protein
MANYASSVLKTGQAIFTNDFTMKGEWRKPEWWILERVMKGGIASPNLAPLRTGESRLTEAYLPIRQGEGSSTGITINHTGGPGDSQAEAITYSGFLREDFSVSLKRPDSNVFDYAEIFATTLRDKIWNLLSRSKAALVASLIADRTQVNAGGANGVFDGTDFVYEIAQANKDYFYEEIRAMMQKNEYHTNSMVLMDSKAQVLANQLGAQGPSNDTNLSWQLAGMELIPTNETLLGGLTDTYVGATLAMPLDGVAYIPWIPQANRAQTLDSMRPERTGGDFGHIMIPEIGVPIGVHAFEKQADTSASGGSAQDRVLQVQVYIDWAYISSPLSTANASVIHGVGLLQ